MLLKKLHHNPLVYCGMALAAVGLSACSFMHEDLPLCEQVVRVHLKYDYNIQRADMFSDHVGEVRVFVVDDATDSIVCDTVVSNRDHNDALKHHPESQTYFVEFPHLSAGKSYRFVATGLQRPYDETLRNGSDRFVGTFPTTKEDVKTLQMHLTHSSAPDSMMQYAVTAPKTGLDTLWMGHTDKPVFVPAEQNRNYTIHDTISLVRDTKYLQVLVHQDLASDQLSADDYELEVVAKNSTLLWDNEVVDTTTLRYTPHFCRTVEQVETNDEGTVLKRSAFYEISFSRLMVYQGEEFAKNARLHLIRKAKGELPRRVIANLNLPLSLAEGRQMASWMYSPQEYLDREYNYALHFYFYGAELKDITLVGVNVTPWTIRLQNEGL